MSDLDIKQNGRLFRGTRIKRFVLGEQTQLTFKIFFSTIILYNWAIIKPEQQVDTIFRRILFTHTELSKKQKCGGEDLVLWL